MNESKAMLELAVARLREYVAPLDSDANADASEPNLREDVETICNAALRSSAPQGDERALIEQFADRCFDHAGEGASYPTVLQAMKDLAASLAAGTPGK